jgi:hypothetical protein
MTERCYMVASAHGALSLLAVLVTVCVQFSTAAISAEHTQLASVEPLEPHQAPQRRGFTRTVASQQAKHAAFAVTS